MPVTNQQLLKEMREGFKQVDKKLERLEMTVFNHDNSFKNLVTRDDLKTLVTRDDFDAFKKENLKAHEEMAASLEELGQEFTSFTGAHDRLQERVDRHEKVLKKQKLLPASA